MLTRILELIEDNIGFMHMHFHFNELTWKGVFQLVFSDRKKNSRSVIHSYYDDCSFILARGCYANFKELGLAESTPQCHLTSRHQMMMIIAGTCFVLQNIPQYDDDTTSRGVVY